MPEANETAVDSLKLGDVAVCHLVVAMVGAFSNILIVAATVKSKTLKNKCNYLMAILAACDFFSEIKIASSAYITLLGSEENLSNMACLRRFFFLIFFVLCGIPMVLLVGVDRLLAVKLPVRYQKFPFASYVALMTFLSALYAIGLLGAAFYYSSDTAIVYDCTVATAFRGVAYNLLFTTLFILIISVIVVYVWAYAIVVRQSRVQENATSMQFQRSKYLMQSLLIVVIIYIISYSTPPLLMTIANQLDLSDVTLARVYGYSAVLAGIAYASNGFVYGLRSREYRSAYREVLCCLCKCNTTVENIELWAVPGTSQPRNAVAPMPSKTKSFSKGPGFPHQKSLTLKD